MILTAFPSPRPLIAMDRAPDSVRKFDKNGRLHVEVSNISKANVCPYLGSEIPRWREDGLDPNHVYMLLRDPDELAKGVDSFNNLPVLSEHVPVTAFDDESHGADLVVGSTGTDAAIDGPYVTNSLVVWAKPSIDGIVNDEKRELSSAYWYKVDWTAGEYEGVAYDGVMRDIVGNHVALVFDGRAGSDVIVGDGKPMALKSRRAVMVMGGLSVALRPLLAQDAKLNLSPLLDKVTDKSLKRKGATKALADRVFGLVQPHLAQDADLDVDAVCKVIDAVQGTPMAEDEEDEIDGMKPAQDEDPDEDIAEDEDADGKDKDDKPAMDAAIRTATGKVETKLRGEFAAIRTAEREVFPVTGELVAMDSAADIYKAGLEALNVDTDGLPASAFAATFRAIRKAAPTETPAIAQDAAGAASARENFNKRYGNRFTLVKG